MIDAPDTSEMFTNMLMATGVLIGAVVVLVVLAFVVYHKTAVHHTTPGDRHWS